MNNNDYSGTDHQTLSQQRREYLLGGLRRQDLPAEPMSLFAQWLQEAIEAQIVDPGAMCIATVDSQGQPWQRIVLLKDYANESLVFFTNLQSRKSRHLHNNKQISAHFAWLPLERQVMVTGVVQSLPRQQVIDYFSARPRTSQIGALASQQSQPITGRSVLEQAYQQIEQAYHNQPVPVPEQWGGYQIRLKTIEFWQGGTRRLHDRFEYKKSDNRWNIERLAP